MPLRGGETRSTDAYACFSGTPDDLAGGDTAKFESRVGSSAATNDGAVR